jgi:sortase B
MIKIRPKGRILYYNRIMKRIVLIIIAVICAIVFAVCAYLLVDYFLESHRSEKAFNGLRGPDAGNEDQDAPSVDAGTYKLRQQWLLKLKEENGDLVGWLTIEGTKVDYPVMQTPDDQDFYLHRDFEKQYSSAGTLFASDISRIGTDTDTDTDAPSDVITIYGHMMKAGTMFGGLKKYTDASYRESHRMIRFDTLTEERTYEIVCVYKTAVGTGLESEFKYYNYADFEDEAAYDQYIGQSISRQFYSTGVETAFGDEFIQLSTCEYSQANGRLVILARRVS